MNRLVFSIGINAPSEKVWKTMLEDETYRKWTSAFSEGSYAQTDWKQGSKALFLDPQGNGMIGKIAVHRPNDYLEIQHLGMIKNGAEDFDSDEVKGWAGALETYQIQEADGVSTLTVESDINDDYKEMFEKIWPKALQKLKELSEKP